MDISDVGNISSIIGLVISVITLIIVAIVDRKVRKLQYSNLFDKTINKHLKNIDKLQNELNSFLPDIVSDEIRIKEILVQLMTEFESLSPKLKNRSARRKTNKLVNKIKNSKNKLFYNTSKKEINIWDRLLTFYKRNFSNMISSREILDIYIIVNENYNRIIQIKINKNAYIR